MEQKIFTRRTEEEVLRELRGIPEAYRLYQGWNEELRERFMAFCMGKKTLPVLYDAGREGILLFGGFVASSV